MEENKKIRKPKSLGSMNRAKGHRAERIYAKIFREDLGYDKCKTTREMSRLLDSCKIDLGFIPFNIQIKAGSQKGINPRVLLEEMKNEMIKKIPSEDLQHTYPKLVIHHPIAKQGSKEKQDALVTMSFNDFKTIIKNKK